MSLSRRLTRVVSRFWVTVHVSVVSGVAVRRYSVRLTLRLTECRTTAPLRTRSRRSRSVVVLRTFVTASSVVLTISVVQACCAGCSICSTASRVVVVPRTPLGSEAKPTTFSPSVAVGLAAVVPAYVAPQRCSERWTSAIQRAWSMLAGTDGLTYQLPGTAGPVEAGIGSVRSKPWASAAGALHTAIRPVTARAVPTRRIDRYNRVAGASDHQPFVHRKRVSSG
jgi:hypothetical protein